jgi:general secretion pathway protein A
MAGANKREKNLFSDPAIERIHQYANGIPRLINTLCESALIGAFAMKASQVSPELVDEAATDFRLATRAVAV